MSLVVLAAVPVFMLFVGFRLLHGREAVARVNAENAAYERRIEALEAENRGYLAVLENNDPEVFRDYVIRVARERLGLSLPGDQVFVDRAPYHANQPY